MVELAILLGLAGLSVRERVRLKTRTFSDLGDVLGNSKASMFSEAIGGLVATAGGIYLSLVLLATFLRLELPSTINFYHIRFEPVAGTAVLLALFQPFLMRILNRIMK